MSTVVSHARRGSQQRGDDARRRLLDAGLELFAKDGFEGTSTRALAEKAGVNLPAIPYYFGSKEGLYRAIVDEIVQYMDEHLGPVSVRINTELRAGETARRVLVDLLCDVLHVLVALMLDDEQARNRDNRQKFFARMEVEPDAAFEVLQAAMIRNVFAPCCDIIGRLTNRLADDEQVLLRTMTIIGQVKIFCGWGTTGLLHWHSISDDHVRAAQSVIREHVEAIFASYLS